MANPLLEKRLTPWRRAMGLAALLLLAAPLAFPFLETAAQLPIAASGDARRLLSHSLNTLYLVAGTLLLSLPVGVWLSVILFRTDLPIRRFFQAAVILCLFIPLPVTLSAWQGLLGSNGWLPISWWENRPGQPWSAGLLPAIWVHALSALPWIILLVGLALTWVERALEEEAILRYPPWQVCRRITLPRAKGGIFIAAVFVALQTAGEITIVDMFQVTTLAEEVYLQLALGDRPALARALLGLLPSIAFSFTAVCWLASHVRNALPPLVDWHPTPLVFPLGKARWPLATLLLAGTVAFLAFPMCSLIYKLGLLSPHLWSTHEAMTRLQLAFHLHGLDVACMLLLAGFTGTFIAWLGLFLGWLMHGSALVSRLFAILALLLATLPAPALGLGLKELILVVVDWDASNLFAHLFYDHGPWSIVWAQTLRYLPYALAVGWTLNRMIPRSYIEAVRLEGYGICGEWRRLIWPMTRRAWLGSSLLMAALCLSETAASGRVETPGWETFARLLFDRMHYGIDAEVAGLALVMVLEIMVVLAAGLLLWKFVARRSHTKRSSD